MMINITLANYVHLAKAESQALQELENNEKILKQIFPRHIFERMKKQEDRQRIAERFESASVMFIDIVVFTELSAKESPDHVLIFLDHVFEHIDAIVARHHLEKIKTIGDAYLLAGGLRELRKGETDEERGLNDLRRTAACGLAILQVLQEKSFLVGLSRFTLSLRLGIHYGPIVAGVFGDHKFSYDIWGDTVNTANRMQTLAKPGSLDPYRYLTQVFAELPLATTADDSEQLLPWNTAL